MNLISVFSKDNSKSYRFYRVEVLTNASINICTQNIISIFLNIAFCIIDSVIGNIIKLPACKAGWHCACVKSDSLFYFYITHSQSTLLRLKVIKAYSQAEKIMY